MKLDESRIEAELWVANPKPCELTHGREPFSYGDWLVHFKHDLTEGDERRYTYIFLHHAVNSETGEVMCVYRADYGFKDLYVRPAGMFYSECPKEKYPTAKQKYRFQLVMAEGETCDD